MATETPQRTSGNGEPKNSHEAVQTAAEGGLNPADPKDAQTIASATDWFLSENEEEVASAVVPVNVAPAGQKENVVNFKVQVVPREEIKRLRKEAERTLSNGEIEIDEMEANLRIVVAGLLEPNVKGDERMRTVRGQKYLDPGDALLARFAHKPGLIDQLSAQIVQISGYKANDVKEIKAAGNS